VGNINRNAVGFPSVSFLDQIHSNKVQVHKICDSNQANKEAADVQYEPLLLSKTFLLFYLYFNGS
jgi:hypothetical protein